MTGPTAIISPTSPRRAAWLEVFGGDTVPVQSPLAVRNQGPDGEAEFYKLDVARLSPSQRAALIRFLAARWRLPVDEVARSIDDPAHGVPILASDVTVAMDLRLFL